MFLAGWALRYVVGPPERQQSAWYLMLRLEGRALTLYAAQILITDDGDRDAGRHGAVDRRIRCCSNGTTPRAVFQDPIATHVGLALLTHQLGYFNILPLYVVLMMMAPFFVLLDRYVPQLLLAGVARDLLHRARLQHHDPDLAGGWRVVLQSVRLAA